ncbi:MAG TPA: DUF4147 domain-containing protein, partial [Pyrinomonadaceae bacterium]|nr:DUF4147 domain-containing protein [Pyrinomonadaceae bacterium]
MSDLERLQRNARAIFDYAISSVDPRQAVVDFCRAHLSTSSYSSIYAIAIGKAATSMAVGLEQGLGERLA